MRRRQPDVLRAQHEERLREAREREHRGDADDDRVAARRRRRASAMRQRAARCRVAACAAAARRLLDAEDDQQQHARATPGTTATQNAAWKSPAKYAIAPIASSGPPTPPTVSSAWRSPKLRAAQLGRRESAISASRGAPRMPLPTRSTKRAATIQPSVGASGNTSLVQRREAVAQHARAACGAGSSRKGRPRTP